MKSPIPQHPAGETMKAVCFTKFGKKGKDPSEVLSVQTIPKPFISSQGEVLIRVHAAALNPIDKIRLEGGMAMVLPEEYDTSVLGYDVAGRVEEVGSEVSTYKVGDEVYARIRALNYGALAEYVVADADTVGHKPANISFSEAAAVPLAGLTALQSLRRGGVTKGSKVFIAGGAGGVGSLAIQIAKSMLGASHVATTASPGVGTEICKAMGADQVVDYRSQDFAEVLKGQDFDMAFDTCDEGDRMGGLLKEGGNIISISGTPTIEAISEISKGSPGFVVQAFMWLSRNRKAERAATSKGGKWEYIFMTPSGKDLDDIAEHLKTGAIKPQIDVEVSLDDFKVAVDRLWSGRSKGKCVIKVCD
jgi:alcohol dehydrogenase